MKCGSLFAGIGGFDLGFERAGIKTIWQVEIEPFCRSVLEKRFPDAIQYTDVRECGKRNLRAVDVVTAGFPCQDLSVAGKRAGLEGSRSGLFWEVVRILGELRPTWFVLENVPGLFSSCEGRDFAVVLNALDELGYGLAWRVLNSQYFGVAQRRRRVFIVGCLGKPCPEAVLFESESGGGNIAESEEARKDVAVPLTSGAGVTGSSAGRRCEDDFNLAVAISASAGHHGHSSPRGDGSDNLVAASYVPNTAPSLTARAYKGTRCDIEEPAFVAYTIPYAHRGVGQGHNTTYLPVVNALGTASGGPDDNDAQSGHIVSAPANPDGVRSFTGLPQGMDSARYRALGNAVTANVSEWIGRRILEVANG